MSEQAEWYVMQGEEQIGPYTGEQLAEYAGNGSIIRESLVWAEGMEEWLPAEQIENLFPPAPAPVATHPGFAPTPNPYAPPEAAGYGVIPNDGTYPAVSVKGASFGMWMGLLIGGGVLALLALFMAGSLANSSRDTSTLSMILLGVAVIGYILTLISAILYWIYLYRSWKCIEFGGFARTSPGKAIGFMFIPFFNLYWLFQAIAGLAKDWNTTVSSYQELQGAPRMSEGVFLTFAICSLVFPPVNLVLIFIMISQMCQGINFFAFRPSQQLGGGPGGSLGGSLGGTIGGFTVR